MDFDFRKNSESSREAPVRLSEKTMLSVQLVAMLCVFVIWLIRLGDKVEQQAKSIAELHEEVRYHQKLLDQCRAK